MNIFRIIALAIIIWLLVRIVRNYRDKRRIATSRPNNTLDTMVQCAHCGLHVPKQEAISKGERFYCCKEHSEAD